MLTNLFTKSNIETTDYNPIKLVLIHSLAFCLLFFCLYLLGTISVLPSVVSLSNYDVGWYHSIVTEGYKYDPNAQCNVAFFPLFPLLWKTLGVNALIISIVNAFIYLFSSIYFLKKYKPKLINALFLISSPSLVFCFFPYSEALFLLFTSFLLIGLDEKKNSLIFLGVLGCGLSRSAIVIFLPAFLFLWVMSLKKGKIVFKDYLIVILSLIGSILLTVYIQWEDTGHWFVFSDPQKHWGHVIKMIDYPLITWGDTAFPLDMSAIIICVCCMIEIGILFLNKIDLLANRNLNIIKSSEYFSLGYCCSIGLFILLFQGGDLHSVNRYIFGTFYFWCFCSYFWKNKKILQRYVLILLPIFIVLAGLPTLEGEFSHLKPIVKIFTLPFVVLLPLFINRATKSLTLINIICILGFFILKVHFLHIFLSGRWIG